MITEDPDISENDQVIELNGLEEIRNAIKSRIAAGEFTPYKLAAVAFPGMGDTGVYNFLKAKARRPHLRTIVGILRASYEQVEWDRSDTGAYRFKVRSPKTPARRL